MKKVFFAILLIAGNAYSAPQNASKAEEVKIQKYYLKQVQGARLLIKIEPDSAKKQWVFKRMLARAKSSPNVKFLLFDPFRSYRLNQIEQKINEKDWNGLDQLLQGVEKDLL